MTNINLSQSVKMETVSKQKSQSMHRGVFIPLGILVVTLLAFGAARIYIGVLDSKIAQTKKQTGDKLTEIGGADINKIMDLQNRMEKIAASIGLKKDPGELLSVIEEAMVSGNYLNVYDYDDSNAVVSLTVTANNFENMAKQILSLKGKFNNVNLGTSSRDSDGNIRFDVIMSLVK